jgi:ABC-2 type transport system permease protein
MAATLLPQTRAIVWAQFRTMVNFLSRGSSRGPVMFTAAMSAVWYGLVCFGAWSVMVLLSDSAKLEQARELAPRGVFYTFLYWQIVPLMLGAAGAQLDMKRLVVYPVADRQLFALEVLLRLSTGVEMLIVMLGAAVGVARNPSIPIWALAGFAPWVALNLFLAVGLRDLLTRLLAGRRTREIATLALVLLAAAPQLLSIWSPPPGVRRWLSVSALGHAPWELTARHILGSATPASAAAMLAWTAAAFWFGRWQFLRTLRFDADAARSRPADARSRWSGMVESVYRFPSRLFADPLAAVVEKELRSLSRSPRFRLVFIMGFSFGLLIWMPVVFRAESFGEGFLSNHYMTIVTFYAMLLLGEVLFWNIFGFDRGASQIYHLLPVGFGQVIAGKNIAAVFYILLEVAMVVAVCVAFRLPAGWGRVAEALSVALVMSCYLVTVGNLISVYFPRPVNPSQSWKSNSAGRVQAALVFLYPVLAFPVLLAFLARYAAAAEWAFWAMMAFNAALGAVAYRISLASAVQAAAARRELMVTALSAGEGPVSG